VSTSVWATKEKRAEVAKGVEIEATKASRG